MSWFNIVFAAAGLILPPFGLIPEKSSWHGFESEGSVLFVGRVDQMDSANCKDWMDQLNSDSLGTPWEIERLKDLWSPWEEEERQIIKDCETSPCKVKLNEFESAKLLHTPPDHRFGFYLSMIDNRAKEYLKFQKHTGYEFPGEPFDVWAYFKKYKIDQLGVFDSSSALQKTKSQLWARKIEFGSSRARPLHQILDRKVIKASSGQAMTVWIRDVYTDHYFDSWGEWIHIQCHYPKKGALTWIHILALDFDLLKKEDLVSRIARGSMRSGVKAQGFLYLDQYLEKLKNRIQSNK